MKQIKIVKSMAFLATLLAAIQLLCIVLKQIIFLFIERNDYTDHVESMLGMLILQLYLFL